MYTFIQRLREKKLLFSKHGKCLFLQIPLNGIFLNKQYNQILSLRYFHLVFEITLYLILSHFCLYYRKLNSKLYLAVWFTRRLQYCDSRCLSSSAENCNYRLVKQIFCHGNGVITCDKTRTKLMICNANKLLLPPLLNQLISIIISNFLFLNTHTHEYAVD